MARHAVGNQMSIGSEKVPISADRAWNGKFESTPLQRRVRNEPVPGHSPDTFPLRQRLLRRGRRWRSRRATAKPHFSTQRVFRRGSDP
jgi:hypothetical protein